jgi:hypothetical protein
MWRDKDKAMLREETLVGLVLFKLEHHLVFRL